MTFGNGLTQATEIEPRLQPCEINLNSSGSLLNGCGITPSGNIQDHHYGFGSWGSTNNGDVTAWIASGTQNFNRSYSYDGVNRLSTLSSPSDPNGCTGLSWTYDAWSNRTDQTVTGGSCPSFHQTINSQNRLANSPYQYDSAGNLIADGSHTYFYDAENHMVQVDGTFGTCSTATACYLYDALGHRTVKQTGSTSISYVHDPAGDVVTEWCTNCDGYTGWATGYTYFNGALAAEYSGGTTYFVHTDHLSSTRLLTDLNQNVVQSLDYLPFGEHNSTDSGVTSHEFTGDEQDTETGLAHTQFRQYSSSYARWMTPDPAGLAAVDPTNPQSWNRYAYVLNNLVAMVDPSGLGPCPPQYASYCNMGNHSYGVGYQWNGWDMAWDEFDIVEMILGPDQTADVTTSINGVQLSEALTFFPGDLSIWDFFTTPWSGSVVFPLVFFGPVASAGAGPTIAYNPKTDTGCFGLAVGAMVPAGGRAAAVGPLTVGNLGNADKILAGGSVFAGAQSLSPAVGVQAMGNNSGLLAGPTFGTPGIVAGASVSKCQGGVGNKLLNWFLNSIL